MRRHLLTTLALVAGFGLSGCYWLYCDEDEPEPEPTIYACGEPGTRHVQEDGTLVVCDYGSTCYACSPSGACYWCQDTGYECICDAPMNCTENSDCLDGMYCDSSLGSCVQSEYCTDDRDCPLDMQCDVDRGTCVPSEEPPPTSCRGDDDCAVGQFCDSSGHCRASQTCSTHEDCTLPGLGYCDDRGTCVPSPGAECVTSNECESGERCVDGFCTEWNDGGGQCQFDEQCDGGQGLCVDGTCHAACNGDDECGTGEICDGGYCRFQEDTQNGCRYNSDCAPGQVCIDTVCHDTGCTQDTDCTTAGDRCVDGVCVADEAPQPECTQNSDCTEQGYECVEGVCRKPCTVADPDCTSCGMTYCIRGYCYDEEPQCMVSADCAPGETCVDAQCVTQ